MTDDREAQRKRNLDDLRHLCAMHGLDPDAQPPRTVAALVFALGPGVQHMWDLVAHESTSMRWLAVTLAYWSKRSADRAREFDVAMAEVVDTLDPAQFGAPE